MKLLTRFSHAKTKQKGGQIKEDKIFNFYQYSMLAGAQGGDTRGVLLRA